MKRQQLTWDEFWGLEEEELENLLTADENLLDLEQETKKVDRSVFEKMLNQPPLTPTPYQPKPPPRRRGSERKTRRIQQEFEPPERWGSREQPGTVNELTDLYGDVERRGTEAKGRRFIKWTFINDLEKDQTDKFMEKISRNATNAFYMVYTRVIVLKNIEDGRLIPYYKNEGSPWMKRLEDAREWLEAREAERLDYDDEGPNTKWFPEEHFKIEVKIVQDQNASLLGTGRLPDWLRNLSHSRAMVALDNYEDNLCLWRCIAVYHGSDPERSTRVARSLAKAYFNLAKTPKDVAKTPLDELAEVERHLNQGKPLEEWLGIRVYEPKKEKDGQVIWILKRSPPAVFKKVMTIGHYLDHAFLIKDIAKLAKNYECRDCHQRFTRTVVLKTHSNTCSQGKTVIVCPGQKVEKPRTVYERAFFPPNYASKTSLSWLRREEHRRRTHIHHAMCGHGGERWIKGAPVDGYDPRTRTIYQYHGCPWHGCRTCFPQGRERIIGDGNKTLEERFVATKKRTEELREAGYRVVEAWECEVKTRTGVEEPKEETKSYPHAIFFDFESYLDPTKRKRVTPMFSIENEHVPISVSIGDTLEREPTHICERDPEQLVRMFVKEIERRGKAIRKQVREEFAPGDIRLLPRKQREQINEWCNQVPILGFNSGKYDLNLIKKHFVDKMAETDKRVVVAKKGGKTMFMHTQEFRFLDIINYVGPGTSYEKWVKAYGSEGEKSWFPYEWFDTPEKLDFPGLPEYAEWYSALKGDYVLTLDEYARCVRSFKEKGMRTFADWLRDYNNQDVGPGLEALQRMRSFYTEKGIDILKDAVSLPGVSLHYLLRGAVDRGADLHSPRKEEYEMLKGAVVGGPSIVFTRLHEVEKTLIRENKVKEPRLCKKILGYDANALYLSTMLKEMPCGRGKVVVYKAAFEQEASELMRRQKEGKWFGFAEVDIEIPESLWPKFEEMCPFFYKKKVPEHAVSEKMKEYLSRTGRKRGDMQKLVAALSAEKILLYAPLLRWYVDHGAVITRVHRTIDYKPAKIFTWFVDQVTEARRLGDEDKSKALLAEVFKLLGNSAYGKMIEAVERQTTNLYTKDERVVDKTLRSAYFKDLEEIGEAYELESRKVRVVIRRPFQVGIAVYQLAKLRMLEFYYDFLDKFIERRDFELIQMDTDSNYMAIAGEGLEDVVRPELKEEFEAEKSQWLSWDKWSGRTPGLFKLEGEGRRMIALCSKCYFIDDESGEKKKLSTKGMSKKQNELKWERFKAALEGEKDMAVNRGFKMRDGRMITYEQKKLGLSAYYDKRWVLSDGVHTEPIKFHM